MATITLRAVKGSPLTNSQVDANFSNLNTEKIERDGSIPMTGKLTLDTPVSGNASINFPSGTNPSSPVSGDIWNNSGTLKLYNGTTTLSFVAANTDVTFTSINVGTATGATTGQVRASGDIIAFSSSDSRLKTNVQQITNALEKITALRGVTYDWNETAEATYNFTGPDIGVIAQEVNDVLPQIVKTRIDGYMAVRYERLIALLIEAIKELNTKVDNK